MSNLTIRYLQYEYLMVLYQEHPKIPQPIWFCQPEPCKGSDSHKTLCIFIDHSA